MMLQRLNPVLVVAVLAACPAGHSSRITAQAPQASQAAQGHVMKQDDKLKWGPAAS